MVDGYEYYISETGGILSVVSILFNAVASGEPAAMNPEKHRPALAVGDSGREDVEAETILAHVVIIPMVPERREFVLIPALHI